jgi:hypothetical protein
VKIASTLSLLLQMHIFKKNIFVDSKNIKIASASKLGFQAELILKKTKPENFTLLFF